MARLASKGTHNLEIRNKALSLTGGLAQKDFRGEACACLAFVRDQIRYVRDIYDVETIATPDWLLKICAGDCDDKATLLAALLGAIGHQVRFVAVAFAPDQFSHVWLQDHIGGAWLDLEATEPYPCGQAIPTGDAVEFLYCEVGQVPWTTFQLLQP